MKRVTQIVGYAGIGTLIAAIAMSRTSKEHVVIEMHTAEVKQGPAWLIELLYDPAGWVLPALSIVGLVVFGLGYLGYHRSGLTEDVQREMVENTLILIFAGAITLAMVNFLSLPYAVDVLTGGIGGFAVARGLSVKYVYTS